MTGLVLGRHGQVASHLRANLAEAEFWGREQLDLAQSHGIAEAILARQPTYIVNAAAYTAVDRAEQEASTAWRINAAAPAAIADAARRLDVPLVHLSTDYVFDGTSTRRYTVDDPVRPINTYGRTKLAGELAVAALCPRHWILRTSWVFSEYGANFVKTMLRLAGERDELTVVADQFGVPTYAADIAGLIATLTADPERLAFGTYHAVGGHETSWCGFAEKIIAAAREIGILERTVDIKPISTAAYPTAARRPARSSLAPSAEIGRLAGVHFDWEIGLTRALEHVKSNR